MSAQSTTSNTATELAKERNRAAADRTLMAWIRTSLSLIAFGFGISRAVDYLESLGRYSDPYFTARIFGGGFIIIGVLALFAAVIQHIRLLRRLEASDFVYFKPWPIGLITAILLLLLGVFAFIAVFL